MNTIKEVCPCGAVFELIHDTATTVTLMELRKVWMEEHSNRWHQPVLKLPYDKSEGNLDDN